MSLISFSQFLLVLPAYAGFHFFFDIELDFHAVLSTTITAEKNFLSPFFAQTN